ACARDGDAGGGAPRNRPSFDGSFGAPPVAVQGRLSQSRDQRHMNIVFFGTSGFAVPALEKMLASEHRVMAVVTQPDRPAGRGQELHQSPVKEIALAKALHLFQPENCNEYEFLRELRALSP